MVTALETTYLSWDLVSPKEYVAGSELQCTLSFAAPKVGKYYLLGALYDTGAGTMKARVGVVSRGAFVNAYGKQVLAFWPIYLPGLV